MQLLLSLKKKFKNALPFLAFSKQSAMQKETTYILPCFENL